MGVYGNLWGPMRTYGDLRAPMRAYRYRWQCMGTYGVLWGRVGVYGGRLWAPLGTYEGVWGPMGTYGDQLGRGVGETWYRRTAFFSGVPPEGRGARKKKRAQKPDISLTECIFQRNHGYFSPYGWYLSLRAQRPPVCSGCSAAPHSGLLSAAKTPQIQQ